MTDDARREHDKLLELAGKEITPALARELIGFTGGHVTFIPAKTNRYGGACVIELRKTIEPKRTG